MVGLDGEGLLEGLLDTGEVVLVGFPSSFSLSPPSVFPLNYELY